MFVKKVLLVFKESVFGESVGRSRVGGRCGVAILLGIHLLYLVLHFVQVLSQYLYLLLIRVVQFCLQGRLHLAVKIPVVDEAIVLSAAGDEHELLLLGHLVLLQLLQLGTVLAQLHLEVAGRGGAR